MDEDTSRTDLTSSSRFTGDLYKTEKNRLETQLQDAQSEVYQLRRIMPFLENTNPENPSQTFRTIASECADLREERDRLRQSIDEVQSSKREELQRKQALIDNLRRELEESREERDRYKRKCQQYEHELSNEESLYYRQQMSEARKSPTQIPTSQIQPSTVERESDNDSTMERGKHIDRRVNFQIDQHAAKDPHLRNLYNRMDEENSELSSVVSHSGARNPRQEFNVNCEANFTLTDTPNPVNGIAQPTTNAGVHFNEYINVLHNYRSNVRALYDQMKSTAQFFVDILKRMGYENDPQIQLMMRKINEINLNMQDSKNLSRKVLEDTKQIGVELAEMYKSFDRAGHSPNTSKQNLHAHASPEFEEMLRQKDEFIAALRNDKTDLDNQCQKLQADYNALQELVSGLELRISQSKDKEHELMAELDNRKQVIVSLAQQLQHETHVRDAKLDQVKNRMGNLLQSNKITNQALSNKIRDGAVKSAYVLQSGTHNHRLT